MLKKAITFCALSMAANGFLAANQPTAVTGPSVRLVIAPKQMTSQTGLALMGEIGEKVARVNGTVGYQIGKCQRLKMSVDFLNQKLRYDFNQNVSQCWVRQVAAGAIYKYLLNDNWVDSVDLGGWYSNAPSCEGSALTIVTGTTQQTFRRTIAGSEGWHGSLGTTLFPWSCATVGISAVYDHVEYDKKTGRNKTVSGAGFTIDFNQRLFHRLDLNLKGDWLQPYLYAGGSLNWTVPCAYGDAIVGLYGGYTQGRHGLANNASYGLQLNMAFGNTACVAPFYKKCCVRDKTRPRQDLLEWIADPAVMMPIVLAIADECAPPFAVVLPDVLVDFGPYAINVSGAFLAGGCFAVSYSAKGLPPGASINSSTGVISGSNLGLFSTPFPVTVTAECVCGSASSTFVLTYESLI